MSISQEDKMARLRKKRLEKTGSEVPLTIQRRYKKRLAKWAKLNKEHGRSK